jgi:hypothetical protein
MARPGQTGKTGNPAACPAACTLTLVLSPETVAWGEVVYPSEEGEVVGFELGRWDTQLVREFTDRRGTDAYACQHRRGTSSVSNAYE